MNDQIKNLIKLQELDSQIISLEDEKEKLPRELEEEKSICDDFQNQANELKRELDGLQLKRKEKEIDLESKEEHIEKFQSQLYQVKTNKEYTALQNEINSIKADNSIIEEETLKFLEEIDSKEEELKSKRAEVEQKKKALDLKNKEAEKKLFELERELKRLKNDREEFIPRIEKQVLLKYEKILKVKGSSLALVKIKDSSCQGCFMNLRPQLIHEVKLGEKIIICENCSRIIYLED